MSRYAPFEPAAAVFYTRDAFYDRLDHGVRITFDSEIVCRADNTDLRKGDRGTPLLPDGIYLMEIKTAGAMPIWTAEMLDRLEIYPVSFSKYGTAYMKGLVPAPKNIISGGDFCA